MKKLTIFTFIRDPHNHGKIIGKNILRTVNIHESFIGIGEKGIINRPEFKKLADDLEPSNQGFSVS